MRIVLGLGNPGERYRQTRHNLGFRVVERLASICDVGFRLADELGRRAWTARVEIAGREAILAKPRTYMNRSGRAAAALCAAYGTGPEGLLVVYDDADLEFGRVRVRPRGRAAGHRGIESLIAALRSEEFPRVKLGVRGAGRLDADLVDYVLEEFDAEEQARVGALVDLGAEAVVEVLGSGLETAMNRVNSRRAGTEPEAGEGNR